MTIRVVVGKTEGFISSVGFTAEGIPFLCRGMSGEGLHWSTAAIRKQALIELRYLVGYLKSAGVVVENESILDEVK